MGVMKFVGNKLLAIFLVIVGFALMISMGSSSTTLGWIAIVLFIAAVYFWNHAPF